MQDIERAIKDLEAVAAERYRAGAYPWMAGVPTIQMKMNDTRADQVRGIRNVIARLERSTVDAWHQLCYVDHASKELG